MAHSPAPASWQSRPTAPAVEAAALTDGYSPLQARLTAGRLSAVPSLGVRGTIRPDPSALPHPRDLPDMALAVDRIVRAIEARETVVTLVDFDADGVAAGTVLRFALVDAFGVAPDLVLSMNCHRLKEGYGVTDRVVDRLADLPVVPTLVITADQGSTSGPQIERLQDELSCDCVVTDHHLLGPSGSPAAAVAVVNPVRPDSRFEDASIAGCMVAFLVMTQVRVELVRRGHDLTGRPGLSRCLDILAMGTRADCMDLGKSRLNRWAIQRGEAQIASAPRPFFQALAQTIPFPWDGQTLDFQVNPRINAGGRLGDASRGVRGLCATTLEEARPFVDQLHAANDERKALLAGLIAESASHFEAQHQSGCLGLGRVFVNGHQGVNGLIATRVAEKYGSPTVCLSPTDSDANLLTGSIRTAGAIHAKEVLDQIAAAHPGVLAGHGGHAMAAGIRVYRDKGEFFIALWDAAIQKMTGGNISPVPRYHDGSLGCQITLQVLGEMDELQPFGQGFPTPGFLDEFQLVRVRSMGDGTHLRLDLKAPTGELVQGVWFGAKAQGSPMPLEHGLVRVVYELQRNRWKGRETLQLMIRDAWQAC
ncbi:MAG: single-stranded-DNA-specific exonuclease RecJ [Rhodanobacter sp.]